MLTTNLLRSLSYLEDTCSTLLSHAKRENKYIADKPDTKEFLRFYKELTPFLQQYAVRQNNEVISELVHSLVEYPAVVEAYLNKRKSVWDVLSFNRDDKYYMHSEEYIRLLETVCNAISNLIYQVKINL